PRARAGRPAPARPQPAPERGRDPARPGRQPVPVYRLREHRPRRPDGRRVFGEHGMIPAAFDYHRPQSAAEAATTLAGLGDEAKVLAGGHSLLPLMKLRFAAPVALVDIGDVTELRYVGRGGGEVRVGALTRHRDLAEHPYIRESVPLLAATAAQ